MDELRVLIADDEYIIRDGLRGFPWRDFGCEVVGEAEDGEEALMLAKVMQPDIILTDIKMPEMDGLQFAAASKKELPGVEIVLLTGFDNFDYAQTAIRTGVYDYLLKPVDYEKMKETIGKLCERIRTRASRDMHYKNLQKKYEQSLPLLVNRLTYDLIHGRVYGREDLKRKLELFDVRIDTYMIMVARMKNLEHLLDEQRIEQWLLEFGISNICEEVLSRYCSRVLMDCDSNEYRFILCFPAESREDDCMAISAQACGKIQSAVQGYIGENICFGLSEMGSDAYQMNKYYQQAVEACRQNSVVGDTGFLQYRDVKTAIHSSWLMPEGEKQLLLEAVVAGRVDEVAHALRRLQEDDGAVAEGITAMRYLLTGLLADCICLETGSAARNPIINEGIASFFACETSTDLFAKAKELFLHITRQNGERHKDYHEMTVKRILAYLEEHYHEDISLDHISDVFQLSGSYIGRLIKKHTGQSFLEHLVGIRISSAEQLLGDSNSTVASVAEQVGYRDQSYFISVFKRINGMTPKEYQNFILNAKSSY